VAGQLDKLLHRLQTDNQIRAWSLIITFFGDAIISRGGNVSAKTVQTVLGRTGTGPGTVRTAFSRLKSDDWIVRQKIGRESFYELADDGYLPFKQAAARIYAPVSPGDKENKATWIVAIKDPTEKSSKLVKQGIQITTNCWLFSGDDKKLKDSLKKSDLMLLSGAIEELPSWVTKRLLPSECFEGYVKLQKRFALLGGKTKLDPLDSLVARCLLIHQWRRVLLRTPVLPDEILPKGWPEQDCRAFVAELYHRLLPKSEQWLDEMASCSEGLLPGNDVNVDQRFTSKFTVKLK